MGNGMKVSLRMRTPLWTGGLDGTMDRIHETGILGSLRWWYEVIVRGLGGEACDPTTHQCSFDAEKYRRSKARDKRERLRDAGLCDACQIFGATGWRRRFRLEVRPAEGEIDLTEGMFPSGRVHPAKGQKKYRTGGWMLRGGYFGTLELRFMGEEWVLLCEILPTLLFIEQWGALGPKTSIGYGVIEITELQIRGQTYRRTQDDWRAQLRGLVSQNCQGSRVGRWWSQELPTSFSPHQGDLPALTNMFFGKVRFEVSDSNWWNVFREIQWLQAGRISKNEAWWTGEADKKPTGPFEISNPLPVSRIEHWVRCHNTFPLSPIVRTYLRYGCPPEVNPLVEDEPDFFGFVKGKNRQQSRIRISWAYRTNGHWEMRFWGWWLDENRNIIDQVKSALGVAEEQGQEQERHWHVAQTNDDTLWSQNCLNLKNVRICWFSKINGEGTDAYLQSLLQRCGCEKTHADVQRARR